MLTYVGVMGIVGVGRRGVGRMVAAACVGGLLLGAAGCTAGPKSAPPSPTPTVVPIFASDEEALAAATEAYANYVSIADQIIREGGKDPSRIDEYVSVEMASFETDSFVTLQERSLHGTGESRFFNFSVQQVSPGDSEGKNVVTAYVCSDISGTDVVDKDGNSVVSPDRPDQTPFQVVFDLAKAGSSALIVAQVEVWEGQGICV